MPLNAVGLNSKGLPEWRCCHETALGSIVHAERSPSPAAPKLDHSELEHLKILDEGNTRLERARRPKKGVSNFFLGSPIPGQSLP